VDDDIGRNRLVEVQWRALFEHALDGVAARTARRSSAT